jgi:hypothetical protein
VAKREYESVAVHGPASGEFAWNLLRHLKDEGIPAALVVATDQFRPAEFASFIEQSRRLVIVTSLGDEFPAHMFAVNSRRPLPKGLARISLCARWPMSARIGDHPGKRQSGTEINLTITDLADALQKRRRN